jgi:hypothetical protein
LAAPVGEIVYSMNILSASLIVVAIDPIAATIAWAGWIIKLGFEEFSSANFV